MSEPVPVRREAAPVGGQRSRLARLARTDLRSALVIRASVALAGAALLIAGGVLMALHGVRDNTFPPYVADVHSTTITSYSGPWLAGGIGVGALAGLLLVSVVTDLWRRRSIAGGRLAALAPAAD